MTISFYPDKQVSKKGTCKIYVSISCQSGRYQGSTGISINPANWKKKSELVNQSEPFSDKKNLTLKALRERLENGYEDGIKYQNVPQLQYFGFPDYQ